MTQETTETTHNTAALTARIAELEHLVDHLSAQLLHYTSPVHTHSTTVSHALRVTNDNTVQYTNDQNNQSTDTTHMCIDDVTPPASQEQNVAQLIEERTTLLQQATARLLYELTRVEQSERCHRKNEEELEQRIHERTHELNETMHQLQHEFSLRKQAEQDVQMSQTLLQAIVTHLPVSVYVKNCDGKLLLVNEKVAEFFCKPIKDIVGKYDYELFATDVIERWHAIEEHIRATGTSYEFEETAEDPTNGLRTFLSIKFPLFDATSGAVYAFGGISADITERTRIQDTLRESEIRYRKVSELISNYAYSLAVHTNGTITCEWITDAFERTTGYTVPELEQLGGWQHLIHPDDMPIAHNRAQNLFSGEPNTSEFRIVTRSGATRWLREESTPEWDDTHQHIIRIYSSVQDITERKHVEEAYRSLVDYSAQGLIIVQERRIVFANAAMEHITGYSRDEMCAWGTNQFFHSIHEEDRAMVMQVHANRLANKGAPTNYTCRIIRKDGEIRWMEVYSSLIQYGQSVATQGAFLDITERQMIFDAMRTAKLAAETATRAKTEFIANMSHEIRTPINAIIGLAQVLSGTSLTHIQRDYTDTIYHSGNALLAIVDDIFNFANIEAGNVVIQRQPVALRTCMADAIAPFVAEAEQKQLDLHVEIAPEVPVVLYADGQHIQQIVSNLINNAIKFTPAGHVVLRLTATPRTVSPVVCWLAPPTPQHVATTASSLPHTEMWDIHLSVEDSGIGIANSDQEHIFESFRQVDMSATRMYGGTGLGLAICKHLTTLMGGSIWVESILGKGSTFHVILTVEPANKQLTPAPPPCNESCTAIATTTTSHTRIDIDPTMATRIPLRILLAEDNKVNQKVATRLLERMGYVVDSAMHGAETLEKVQHTTYDVIFMDIQMPEMDGITATRHIRSLPPECQPWIIAMTANTQQSDKDACFAAGMNDYISKPIQLAALQAAIERVQRKQ